MSESVAPPQKKSFFLPGKNIAVRVEIVMLSKHENSRAGKTLWREMPTVFPVDYGFVPAISKTAVSGENAANLLDFL